MTGTCATCAWFKDDTTRYHSGGFCNWRPPMKLRNLLWAHHGERITKPGEEWCGEHRPIDGETPLGGTK